MNVKSNATRGKWIDPDDAPELTDDFFENATPMIGDRAVTKEEFAMAAEAAIRDSKARMNDALRDWLKTNSP